MFEGFVVAERKVCTHWAGCLSSGPSSEYSSGEVSSTLDLLISSGGAYSSSSIWICTRTL